MFGLTNGVPYTFAVTATNEVGMSVSSPTSNAIVPAAVPGSPTNLAIIIGNNSANLSWSAPVSNGGSVLTDYVIEYKLTDGGVWSVFNDGISTNPFATVTSLANNNSYDFRVYAKNIIGPGFASSEVSGTPGSPAQVLIRSFDDLITPGIATAVRITNDGDTAYEYQYTWCVTNSELNTCGGGDDIFNSTAAILIQPHVDFDTILNSTVPTAGNYWFHLIVRFGSDSSEAIQSFTVTTAAPVTPPVTNPGGGGGGGGGGGSSNTVVTTNVNSTSADFNRDGKVNSVDFSIMLAFWKTPYPFKNSYVDINRDMKVNSVDFSILLFQWSKRPVLFKE
jgi:hypothetical protein